MTAYYNENDPKAAAWIKQLIVSGYGNAINADVAQEFINAFMEISQ